MDKKEIGFILKTQRNDANMQTSEVVSALKSRGITISEKTLYGYENGQSAPKIGTLFELCDIYGISDIGFAFGFNKEKTAPNNGDGLSSLDNQLAKMLNFLSEDQKKMLLAQIECLLKSE